LITDELTGKAIIERYWEPDTVSEIRLGLKQEYDEMLLHHFAKQLNA
jgi:hypothetical protein